VTASPDSTPAAPPRGSPGLPRGLEVLVGFAAAIVVLAGVKASSSLVGPAFLALVLTIAVHPMRRWLDRFMPTWAASLVCLLTVYVTVVVLSICIVAAVARFAALLPQYQDQFTDLINNIAAQLKKIGVDADKVHEISSSFDLGSLADLLTSILNGAASLVSDLVFILMLILFMVLDAGQFPRLMGAARQARPQLIEAVDGFAKSTRSYLIVSTVFGLIVAVLDTIALAALGVPAPLVWGLLAFLTNYIPNIGFIIGLIPAAILALLEGGFAQMLWVIVIYCAINLVIQSIIQPKVVGDAVGLSTTLTFLSLVFWSWVLGPIGAVMAIPLSLLVKSVLFDADPDNRWLVPLVANSDSIQESPRTKPAAT
jgi:predicted PurR-regulated permease PerM